MSTSTRVPLVDAVRGKTDAGLQTFGEMIVMAIQASVFVVVDIVRGRFSWREFICATSPASRTSSRGAIRTSASC